MTFGDLTVLVGPQATGKSIFLQMLKLLVDAGPVLGELKRFNIDWGGQLPNLLELYSCCFAEVHPANTTSAADLIGKKRDVESRLSENASAVRKLAHKTATRLNAPAWHWLATDASIAIRKGSQASRQLAAAGVSGPKRRLELD